MRLYASLGILFCLLPKNLGASPHTRFEKEVYSLQGVHQTETFEVLGEFYFRPGDRVTLAAPHGDFDIGTYDIVKALCESNPDWTCLLANRFRRTDRDSIPYNVNRPTILDNDDCAQADPMASRVFGAWMEKINRQRPKLYIEIHGNVRPESAERIEVAHKGFPPEELRNLFDDPLFAIEGIDDIWFRASQNKACGSMNAMDKAIHFELPAMLRETTAQRGQAIRVLEKYIRRIATIANPA